MSLVEVRTRIATAARQADRDPAAIKVVVVTKGRGLDEIREVYAEGIRDFGENRAQEMVTKVPELPSDIRWHFVGPLQTNKVRRVRPVTHLLHSLDRVRLAEAWVKGPGMPPPALLEINIGREPQKHGFVPTEAEDATAACVDLGVELRGVMAIPPQGAGPEIYAELAQIRDRLRTRWDRVTEISAGMTDDLEAAVQAGATMVRPGRAIFD